MALPEIAALNDCRLANDWTWKRLADEMRKLDIDMSERTLHYLVKRMPADRAPRDRTLYKIRKFLEHHRTPATRPRPRRQATTTTTTLDARV